MAMNRNGSSGNDYGPKKADIILRANQAIANKQDELIKQTKINNSRVEAMLENFSKSMQETVTAAKQSAELFRQLQSENQTLRQELLYLAKQNENIYAGLADRINELAEQSTTRENAYSGLADKVNDVCEQIKKEKDDSAEIYEKINVLTEENRRSEGEYSELLVKLSEISDRIKHNEELYGELSTKIEHIHITAEEGNVQTVQVDDAAYTALADKVSDLAEHTRRSENAYSDLADRINDLADQSRRSESAYTDLSFKISDVCENVRRSEGTYSALSEKLDAISVRVQLYGEESARAAAAAAQQNVSAVAPAPVQLPMQTFVKEEVDYDKLAEKVAALVSAREVISPDYIASKVAEQIIVPAASVSEGANVNISLDEGNIARQVADYLNLNGFNTNVTVDEEKIARNVAALINANGVRVVSEVTEQYAQPVQPAQPVVVQSPLGIDEEELADRIALKVGSLKAEDFEILVDDDGCSSISKEICDKLDYAAISEAVADKLRYALDLAQSEEPDYEEMAARISEKITVAGINEDAIADKAAAVLSNYLPDFDMDEISAKVTDAVIDVLNAQFANQPAAGVEVDSEKICNSISERLIESQADHDYDIVIDEDGISRMTVLVAEEVEKGTDARFNQIEAQIAEIKEMLEKGVVGTTDSATEERFIQIENAIAQIRELFESLSDGGETEERFNQIEAKIAEIKEMLESGANGDADGIDERFNQIEAKIAEIKEMLESGSKDDTDDIDARFSQIESAISDIKEMLESGALVQSAPVAEAAVSSAVEKQDDEPLLKVSEVISQPPIIIQMPPVPAKDEEPEEEEEIGDDDERLEKDDDDSGDGDDLDFGEAGVDFSNMMKFNRSFIARIIQGTDEQKNYYGAVKQALLSYKKVNSNIAWGAERFNKGRETIARFKIRGKTLCLYLALDPNEYKVSVYHHLDASDNKSMNGTPMMVKIKSPLGVKKAIRLIDQMLEARGGIKRELMERDYAAMYPYENIEELIEEGLVKDVRKKNQ